uniref:Glutamate--cysteine ligase n=1 Tax=Panagrolaimus superbus TaxID=310955 RepID=A0A914XYW3_9BILA
MEEAKWLYDQLTPLTPILTALSAATPIHRSYLSDMDSRWDIITQGNDDRTPEERGLFEEKHYQKLICAGIEVPIAQHIANMFIRDPLLVLKDQIEQDDESCTDHFDYLQISVWNSMRFKPPPPDNDSNIGWRVEFRPTEIQLTDFENSAFSIFVVLLTRVIISYNLIFVTNVSKINQNMTRAVKRDAVLNEKLCFRNKLVTCEMTSEGKRKVRGKSETEISTDDLTVNEIINGMKNMFKSIFTYRQCHFRK